ncbi:hypothetical protein DFP72DRAFT_614506 [Ephemerocybe angulata]|uniref:Uncharacterized protein n=1 Tax=Ephemerocybe angulata TaxID=980116 RepID=A0A8H6HH45_9AGAR|nr:hypothetical protein DFP72DRAFT_614506 [Tulosesus angulatus]
MHACWQHVQAGPHPSRRLHALLLLSIFRLLSLDDIRWTTYLIICRVKGKRLCALVARTSYTPTRLGHDGDERERAALRNFRPSSIETPSPAFKHVQSSSPNASWQVPIRDLPMHASEMHPPLLHTSRPHPASQMVQVQSSKPVRLPIARARASAAASIEPRTTTLSSRTLKPSSRTLQQNAIALRATAITAP